MQVQFPVLGKFEFGRPQLFAALMLAALAAQTLIFAAREPAMDALRRASRENTAVPSDSILLYRIEQPVLPGQEWPDFQQGRQLFFRIWWRLPVVIFSLWLAGALWWVTRRLYNNAGGYVALGLYCSSPGILRVGARINAEILAAWGLFGLIYTAIGVAHTLYAPSHKWRIRTVLLGLALGFAAAAHLGAAFIGLILAAFFLLYLAPGRRGAAITILLESIVIAAALLWALYGFGTHIRTLDVNAARLSLNSMWRPPEGSFALAALLVMSFITFILWKRTRYFGNWSALLVFVCLAALAPAAGHPRIWALPFAFVFVGGIFADLFETRWREVAITVLLALVAAQEAFLVVMLART